MPVKYGGMQAREVARDIALQSMKILYLKAVEAVRCGELELARNLVAQADEIRRVLRLKKPRFLRRGVCKNCGVPLVPGLTASYRIASDGRVTRLVVTCLQCGYKHRYILIVGRGRRRSEG